MNSEINQPTSASDANRKFGDFTGLASNYSKFRPAYSDSVLTMLLALVDEAPDKMVAADLGAGTGLWTRMVSKRNLKEVFAVEPNLDMRSHGEADSRGLKIKWIEGSGEQTGLASQSLNFVTAASCFHWFDFEKGMGEIARILKPGGRFTALWNPRIIEGIPLFEKIEAKIRELAPEVRRVSSGKSDFTGTLSAKFSGLSQFDDLIYVEGRHTQTMTPSQYIGVWRSVNDIQVQLGVKRFEQFMNFVEDQVAGLPKVDAHYLTRAWTVRRK